MVINKDFWFKFILVINMYMLNKKIVFILFWMELFYGIYEYSWMNGRVFIFLLINYMIKIMNSILYIISSFLIFYS